MKESKPFLKRGGGKLASHFHGTTDFAKKRKEKIIKEQMQRESENTENFYTDDYNTGNYTKVDDNTSLYSILGIDINATDEEITKAYKTLAKKHHPDKGGDIEKFKEIQTAYDILSKN